MSAPVPPPPLPTKTRTINIGDNGAIKSCEILEASTRSGETFSAALKSSATKLGVDTEDKTPIIIASGGIFLAEDETDFKAAKQLFTNAAPVSVSFCTMGEAMLFKESFSTMTPEVVAALKQGQPRGVTMVTSVIAAIPPTVPTRE